MNRWLVSLLVLLIVGCGGSSDSLNQSENVEELDGSGESVSDHPFAPGIDLEHIKMSPLFHEFYVDLLSDEPIQKVDSFKISSDDTYKISLRTLDLLMNEKRFPLVQSSNIIQNGLPKVIAPIGYSVSLEVTKNQVVAIIKSTTKPERSTLAVPVVTGNNDIIVGELSTLNLLFSGIHKDLNQPTLSAAPLTLSATGLHRYMCYNHGGQWFAQLSKSRCGVDASLSAQVGKQWNMLEIGHIQVSAQSLYSRRDSKHVNAASFKYSTPVNKIGFQGHLNVSALLHASFHTAVGIGGQLTPSNQSKLYLGVVASPLGVNVTVDYGFNY